MIKLRGFSGFYSLLFLHENFIVDEILGSFTHFLRPASFYSFSLFYYVEIGFVP